MDIRKTAGTVTLGVLLAVFITLFATWSFSQPSLQNPGILKALEVQNRHTANLLENPGNSSLDGDNPDEYLGVPGGTD